MIIRSVVCIVVLWLAISNVLSAGATTTNHFPQMDSGRLFDQYGVLPLKTENQRLANLSTQLKKEPQTKAFLVMYEGNNDRIRNIESRACRALRHLVANRSINPKHVIAVLIAGGKRETFTVELWLLPADAPDDVPRFQSGLNEKDVLIIRGDETAKKCPRR
jgi:hypothetical protein